LAGLSSEKKKVLEADLAREQEKERLRLLFAQLASEYSRWTREMTDNMDTTHFGFSLDEVENFAKVLDAEDKSFRDESQQRKTQYENVWAEMEKLKVKENIYTQLTPDTLSQSRSAFENAMKSRKEKYDKELALQRHNDSLCKQFATVADPFSKWISEQKDIISKNQKDLEEQLKFVNERLSSLEKDGAKIVDIKAANDKVEAAGIANNRHTTLTLKDLEVQWGQFKRVLECEEENARR